MGSLWPLSNNKAALRWPLDACLVTCQAVVVRAVGGFAMALFGCWMDGFLMIFFVLILLAISLCRGICTSVTVARRNITDFTGCRMVTLTLDPSR